MAVECDDFDVAIDIVKQLKATDRNRGELLSRLSTLKAITMQEDSFNGLVQDNIIVGDCIRNCKKEILNKKYNSK